MKTGWKLVNTFLGVVGSVILFGTGVRIAYETGMHIIPQLPIPIPVAMRSSYAIYIGLNIVVALAELILGLLSTIYIFIRCLKWSNFFKNFLGVEDKFINLRALWYFFGVFLSGLLSGISLLGLTHLFFTVFFWYTVGR